MNANRALKKKIISSTAVALSVMAMGTVAFSDSAAQTPVYVSNGTATAGIVSELSTAQTSAMDYAELTVDEAAISVVAAAAQAPKSKWDSRLMADVDDFVYVRKSASKDGEIVAKLRKGDVATVVSEKGSWTKIKSGDVKGFVKSKYCVTGSEAKSLYKSLDKDEMTTALSIEDEQAFYQMIAQAKAKEQEEAAAQAAAQAPQPAEEAPAAEQDFSQATLNQSVEASVDDVTLLANLIWCEAGGESYEGQLAVGAVVVNRLYAGYASSISGVIYQPYQFSPAGSGKLASAIANGSASSSCYQAAQEALSGITNIGSAKNFHRANGTAGTVIGNHVFF